MAASNERTMQLLDWLTAGLPIAALTAYVLLAAVTILAVVTLIMR